MLGRFWSWLKGWFKRSGFSPKDRAIFSFHDGVGKRWADPFEIQRGLEKHGGKNWLDLFTGLGLGGGIDFEKMSPQLRESTVSNYHEAVKQIANLVRSAFHVTPISTLKFGNNSVAVGLTDAECVKLLNNFLKFLTQLEGEYLPLLLPPAEMGPPAEDSTIEQSSDSPNAEIDSGESSPKT